MKIGIFGGSFDPIHSQHIGCVVAAQRALGLDRLIVMPSYIAPHKRSGAAADGKSRLKMAEIALRGLDFAAVSDEELAAGGTSYTYLTCEKFKARYPAAERYFLVGADMLEDFFTWREPDAILSCVTLAACGRGTASTAALREKFYDRFGKRYAEVPFTGEAVSSTEIRVELAFGKRPAALDGEVYHYISERGLYAYPVIERALSYEKETRREHSFRVAKMACARARSLGIPEEKALLAAALHDCAKNLSADDALVADCRVPSDVPAPVLHQYTGARLAARLGVEDEEILDAIRYHASGREDMTPLGKLIFLSDLLEEGRTFAGVDVLRDLFWKDLDACLEAALRAQLAYLSESGTPIYGLTQSAYDWVVKHKNQPFS